MNHCYAKNKYSAHRQYPVLFTCSQPLTTGIDEKSNDEKLSLSTAQSKRLHIAIYSQICTAINISAGAFLLPIIIYIIVPQHPKPLYNKLLLG